MSSLLAKTLLDGVLLGGIYVTIGAGFALAFGVLDVIDFAVGSYVMLGAYAASALAPLLWNEGLYTIPFIVLDSSCWECSFSRSSALLSAVTVRSRS